MLNLPSSPRDVTPGTLLARMAEQCGEVREITTVTILGQEMPAIKAVCPECRALDLNSTFSALDRGRIRGRCSSGHSWEFRPFDD